MGTWSDLEKEVDMNGSFGFQQFFSNDQNEFQKVSQLFSLLMCVLISFTEGVESIDPFNRKIIEI